MLPWYFFGYDSAKYKSNLFLFCPLMLFDTCICEAALRSRPAKRFMVCWLGLIKRYYLDFCSYRCLLYSSLLSLGYVWRVKIKACPWPSWRGRPGSSEGFVLVKHENVNLLVKQKLLWKRMKSYSLYMCVFSTFVLHKPCSLQISWEYLNHFFVEVCS